MNWTRSDGPDSHVAKLLNRKKEFPDEIMVPNTDLSKIGSLRLGKGYKCVKLSCSGYVCNVYRCKEQ